MESTAPAPAPVPAPAPAPALAAPTPAPAAAVSSTEVVDAPSPSHAHAHAHVHAQQSQSRSQTPTEHQLHPQSHVNGDVPGGSAMPIATQAQAPAPVTATTSTASAALPSAHQPHNRIQVDPPHNDQPMPPSFPSPRQKPSKSFDQDVDLLTLAVHQSTPEAVRRVIRDNFDKALLGSDFHHAFLLNAVIHHANGVIVRRAIKDFGSKMVTEAKQEIISHFKSRDIDDITDAILERCSDAFLDKAMEKRLKTVDARSLINALARAERLGYENSDVIEDYKEKVVTTKPAPVSAPVPPHLAIPTYNHVRQPAPQPPPPSSASPRPTQQHVQHVQHTQPPPPRQLPSTAPLQCRLCWRKFERTAPYEYHVQKQLCSKEPPSLNGFPFTCEHCGAGFITKVGQQYHLTNHVCGDHGTAPATPQQVKSASPITIPSSRSSPSHSQPPPQSRHWPSVNQHQQPAPPTPSQARVPPASASASPSSYDDPYGHLDPRAREQLVEELRQAEEVFKLRFREVEAIADPVERKIRHDGIQNSFSTKQSMIRKKYGVRLRNRRTRAEIDSEKARMGVLKHPLPTSTTNGYGYGYDPAETPAPKRHRADYGPSPAPPPPPPVYPSSQPAVSNHLAVSDMNSGLGGSAATAATTDPTQFLSPSSSRAAAAAPPPPSQPSQNNSNNSNNSLSSYQRKGYRISSHVSQAAAAAPSSAQQQQQQQQQRSGSATAPVVLDDDDDDDDNSETDGTDSDEDIPAKLPGH
ncbi:hypothetical protein F4809DRAFT_599669 [Biscogniauxia mediterranea]|nr:hypothetical protein F4809DRAFT_599669 [Biscogniauxia mediterranea]